MAENAQLKPPRSGNHAGTSTDNGRVALRYSPRPRVLYEELDPSNPGSLPTADSCDLEPPSYAGLPPQYTPGESYFDPYDAPMTIELLEAQAKSDVLVLSIDLTVYDIA
ncbi:hypothetical protein D9756_009319 [Leucocoprinus leucothites]|uniref:Uncharacterized protein n=1 Tax=Leucocoprinus leucothites TaxID=201217 RepID=A0A8H5CX49_9AGAR|nr:hypothetical protein D9756_009319 [Leucoagaricus leucothites]